jgi:hypothetical protein
MSFDLYFYKTKDNPVTEKDVVTYLSNNLSFNNSDYARQWDYENPETGVYFLIDWNDPDEEDEDFDGFTNLNFSFSLNFFRPAFFGMESFPIIEKFVNDLDLFIFDPQDFNERVIPTKLAEGYLENEWIEHNNLVTLEQFEKLNFKYMPIEKSNYLWHVQFNREKLQNSLTEDLFVAGILVLESDTDGLLYTFCVWPTHIPIILPKVDYVIIKKKYKKFFNNIEESGLVAYDKIMAELGDSFEKFDHEVPDLKVLRQNNADKISKQFNKLKIERPAVDFGKMIALDKFVNVRPV